MTNMRRAALAALALVAGLAACGTDQSRLETGREATAEVKAMLRGLFHRGPKGAAPDPQQIAREALAANPGPLMLVSLEATKSTSVFGLRGENNGMRTWFSPSGQGVITRGGILAGTRGFGNDLMSSDIGPLIGAVQGRRTTQVKIELRYLDGLGRERPLPLDCRTGTAAPTGYEFAGMRFEGTPVAVHCEGYGFAFDNSYIVSAAGTVLSSRQWIGPRLGYLTLQSLRD